MGKYTKFKAVTSIFIIFLLISMLLSGCGGGSPSTKITPTPSIKMTHPIKGFENCVSCHADGVNGAPKFPADHAGRTNDQCALCHPAP